MSSNTPLTTPPTRSRSATTESRLDVRPHATHVRERDPAERGAQHEREARPARNQALFRAVNEKLRELNEQFAVMTEEFVIACECADATCVQTLNLSADDYMSVRANPRTFAVLSATSIPRSRTSSATASPMSLSRSSLHPAE
jgi:hypothetical protein